MSTRLRQQILSMSQEDENTDDLPVVEEGADSLEAELAEVNAADQQVVEADQAVEELSEVHESLESIQVSLESALSQGGLDPMGAQMLRHALDASVHRIGFADNTPSLESFGGESDRERATQVSLEGIKERIVAVWRAILAAIQKAWAAVKNFFYKVFGAAPKLLARARALREKCEKTEGAPKADAKIKLSGLAADVAENHAGVEKVQGVIEDVFGEHAGAMVRYGNEVATFLKDADLSDDEKFVKSAEKVTAIKFPAPKATGVSANASDYGVSGTHVVKTSVPLLGGKVLVCVSGKPGSFSGLSGAREYLDRGLGGSKVFLSDAKGHKAREEALEAKPLDKADVLKLAESASRIAKELINYQRGWKGAEAVKEEMKKAGDAYSKKASDKLTGEAASVASSLPKLVREAGNAIDSAQRSTAGYAIQVGQSMIAVGEKSLSTYEKAKAA